MKTGKCCTSTICVGISEGGGRPVPTIGGTQTGPYQTGSYQKGRFIHPKPKLLDLLFFDTTPFICL